MKKLNKLQINSDKIMKNEELVALRGGYGSYSCYALGGYGGCGGGFLAYINTASCDMALTICADVYKGGCVEGGAC